MADAVDDWIIPDHPLAAPSHGTDDWIVPAPANRMAFAPSDLASLAPPMTAGDRVTDAAKSFGSGLARGVVGLSTLPGNIEQLGRAGFNKAFDVGTKLALGRNANVPAPISNETAFPTQNDVIAKDEAKYGKWYEPQTTAGQYARTAGEFAPTALVGGPEVGLATRAANALGPAVASETAGQVAGSQAVQKVAPGLEPWARALAGLYGGPKLPQGIMRTASPLAVDAIRARNVTNLQDAGMSALTAGDITGNKGLRAMESEAGNQLLGGGKARAIEAEKGQQFTQAAWSKGGDAGIGAKDITPETMNEVSDAWGNTFNGLAKATNMMVDKPLINKLNNIRTQFVKDLPAESLRSPMVENIVNDMTNWPKATTLSGTEYQNIRSRIGQAMADNRANNPYLTRHLGYLQDALDDGMQRYASPQVASAWKAARSGYRDFLAVQDAASAAGEATANGMLSPQALRTALKKQEKAGFAQSTRPLKTLATSAEGVYKPIPNSGTPMRQQFKDIFSGGGAAIGSAMGLGVGGPIGAGMGGVAGALLPAATRGLGARAIVSKPVQGYLGNQALARPLAALNAGQLPAWLRPYLGLVGAEGAEGVVTNPSAKKR